MSIDKCPDCGGDLECLGGASAHPNNWYCKNEFKCGWTAWAGSGSNGNLKHNPDVPAGVYERVLESAKVARKILGEAPEINQSNYTYDQVCEINEAVNEAYDLLDSAMGESEGRGHSDDHAVDLFAQKMKTKLKNARFEGRHGWDDPDVCSALDLLECMQEHLDLAKAHDGNWIDLANICMMLHMRGVEPAAICAITKPTAHVSEASSECFEKWFNDLEEKLGYKASYKEKSWAAKAWLAANAAKVSDGPKQYKGPVCKGSWQLGSACGTCERCVETQPK